MLPAISLSPHPDFQPYPCLHLTTSSTPSLNTSALPPRPPAHLLSTHTALFFLGSIWDIPLLETDTLAKINYVTVEATLDSAAPDSIWPPVPDQDPNPRALRERSLDPSIDSGSRMLKGAGSGPVLEENRGHPQSGLCRQAEFRW